MPIVYDIESDYLYKKGFENGIKIAKEREVKKFLTGVICDLRIEGFTIDAIARVVTYTPEQVQEILDEMKMK
jgi:hypothetical protein